MPAATVPVLIALSWLSAAGEDPAGGGGFDLARFLGGIADRTWTVRPEWGDLAVAILKKDDLRPGAAWWRPAQRRYGWDWLAKRADGNSDRRVARTEFPADDLLFERLDRDGDGALTAGDFEAPGPDASAAADALFLHLDRDSNGRLTLEELTGFFRRADGGGMGFLSREDLRRALRDPEAGKGGDGEGMPSPWVLLAMLASGQLGSLTEGPRLGDPAPDFRLPARDGSGEVSLAGLRGKPAVLIFGSFT